MTVDDFFQRLIEALERAEVPYMVTGSYASSAHGTPRATNDIDIIIAPTDAQLWELMREFPSYRYYADEEDAFEALAHRSQFNVVDFATSWKADLIVKKDREFSEVEFSRRRPHVIAGKAVYVVSAEDILPQNWSGISWENQNATTAVARRRSTIAPLTESPPPSSPSSNPHCSSSRTRHSAPALRW